MISGVHPGDHTKKTKTKKVGERGWVRTERGERVSVCKKTVVTHTQVL